MSATEPFNQFRGFVLRAAIDVAQAGCFGEGDHDAMPLRKKASELVADSKRIREDAALAMAHAVTVRLRAQRLLLKAKRRKPRKA